MNKKELVKEVANKTGFNKQEISDTVNAVVDTIIEQLAADDKVYIRGLGVFHPFIQNSRPVRNPKTGEAMMFEPRRSVRLKIGDDVVRKLNK